MQQRVQEQLNLLAEKGIHLDGNGFSETAIEDNDLLSDFHITAIENAMDVIPTLFSWSQRYYKKSGSYGLKHYVTDMYRHTKPDLENTYISNGAFIMAMLLHKFEFKPIKHGIHQNPNCFFKLKQNKLFRTCSGNCLQEKYILEFPRMKSKISNICHDCQEWYDRKHVCGWDSIDDEKKKEINKYIADGFPLTKIAQKFEVPYANLFYWKKRGFLDLKTEVI